jgi:hypothetical protein
VEIIHISANRSRAFPAVLRVDNMYRTSGTLGTFPNEISPSFHTNKLCLQKFGTISFVVALSLPDLSDSAFLEMLFQPGERCIRLVTFWTMIMFSLITRIPDNTTWEFFPASLNLFGTGCKLGNVKLRWNGGLW